MTTIKKKVYPIKKNKLNIRRCPLTYHTTTNRNITISYKKANWYIDYDIVDNTTALVICGADGIGVLFIVLKDNHLDEFKTVIKKYKNFNPNIYGCLGECIRWAAEHKDIIPKRCTIGGFNSKMKF